MSHEQLYDIASWWNDQSFDAKEQFRLDETGLLVLNSAPYVKEHMVGMLSLESADVVLASLREKFAHVEVRVRDVEVEWIAAEDKLKLADKIAHLKEFLNQVHAVGDFEKVGKLVHSWEHALFALSEEHYETKLKMVEMAESVAESTQWKETTQTFRDIADKWKQTGYVDKARNEKLWARFEAARKVFHDRKRLHQAEEEKNMLHNLDLKIELVEQAEKLAASLEWKSTTEAFHKLTEQWKTIGHTLNKKNEELWQRFMAAKSVFFEKKREHSHMVQQEQEANYTMKLALVEKAEALRESTEWSATAQAQAALSEEWKKIGRVPQEKADELRKRFYDAQEQFFDARRKHNESVKSEQESNYAAKKAIVDRAEELKNSSRWGETTGEFADLMEQWKKIGYTPRAYGDKLWEDFNAARKHFFARKDANREQRKQFQENQKAARVEHARSMAHKMEAELREEEEKLADFKNALQNVTPGKKAAELKEHLTKLIGESERNVKKMRDKLASVTEESKNSAKKAASTAEEVADE